MWYICKVVLTQLLLGRSCFILLDSLDYYMRDSLSITVHIFTRCILVSLSIVETLLLRYVNLFSNFREVPFRVEMSPSWLKYMYSILSAFMRRSMHSAACPELCSRDSALVGIFSRNTLSLCIVYCFFSVKPISFIRSINAWRLGRLWTDMGLMIKHISCVLHCCRTPTIMSKKSVFPSGEWNLAFMLL